MQGCSAKASICPTYCQSGMTAPSAGPTVPSSSSTASQQSTTSSKGSAPTPSLPIQMPDSSSSSSSH
jgi:hypothetical protein